jgi:3-phosphoshikimate 1-carboxyvinyltransferase
MKYRSMPSRISGTIRASPSKSITHRAVILGALSGGPCTIRRPLLSDDSLATVSGIRSLGADVTRAGDDLRVASEGLRAPGSPIDARNSGTTLRLLAGVASLLPGTTILTGDESLRRRPMGPLLEALGSLGAHAASRAGDGRPPVEVRGVLRGGTASIDGAISSQFLSSLFLACPLAAEASEIRVRPPVRSEPYLEMTRQIVRLFGAEIHADGALFLIPGGQRYRPVDLTIPGDFSTAAFPLVAAALTDGDVTVDGLAPEGPQGDRAVIDLLRSFGAAVEVGADRVRARGGDLAARTVDVAATPDLFPVLAVLATQAQGESRFVNGSHLRFKESDRIATPVAMLRSLGADAVATEDGCVVRGPTKLRGGSVDSRGDHRILMAAAVAGLVAEEAVDITEPWCFGVSYPSFLDDFRSLGARHAVIG